MDYIIKSEVFMKNKKEVIIRSVCLLTFADRCALEEKVTNGIRHSLNEREQQRNTIIKWLKEKNYYSYLTKKEKQAIETQVVNKTNTEIYNNENDYECIEPLLWSLGLVEEIHNYDEFVLDDLHRPLNIGRNHALEEVEKRCKNVQDDVIKINREISMLWYWRCLECRNSSSKIINYKNAIRDIFGEDNIKILEDYEYYDMDKCDFIVKGKTVAELSGLEIEKLEIIAERRFYAFEWLCSDDNWDNVDLVC